MNTQKENSATDKKKIKRYAFVQKEGDDFTCIKLLEDKYEGVIYKYGKVAFGQNENPDGTLPMKFDYDIIRNPNNLEVADDEDFMEYIGDILLEIMEQQLKDGTAIVNEWTNWNNDIKKLLF